MHRGHGATHLLAYVHKGARLTPAIGRPVTPRGVQGGIVLGQTKLSCMHDSRFTRVNRGGHFLVGQGWKIQNIAQLDRCRQGASLTDRATGVQLGGFSPRAYVLSLPCTHAYTHAPRLTPVAGRFVRRSNKPVRISR